MIEAFIWGSIAASSLLLGAVVVMWRSVGNDLLGLTLGFGAGVLISTVAYELTATAIQTAGTFVPVALGLGVGGITFYVGDVLVDRMGGEHRKRSEQAQAPGFALVLGILLDGIPESLALGISLVYGDSVSLAMLTAIFLANFPEALGATSGLLHAGRSRRWLVQLWLLIIVASGAASAAGYAFFADARPETIAFVLAFAGGAVLTMLADTMMPEAFRLGGRHVGLLTTLGFAVSIATVALDHG